MRQCGGDPAYVEYLGAQHRHLIQEPRAALSVRLAFEAELKAIPAGDPAAVLAALDALSSRVQASSMDRGDKAGLEARIDNRRRGEMLRKNARDRAQAEADAEPVLKALIAEVNAMPATIAGRRRLAELASANRYRLPELSFSQQNRYGGAIERRMAQIDRQLILGKCAGHTARMGLPAPMAEYEIVGQLGMRMGEVVCESIVATGHGEFRQFGPVSAGAYTVRSGDATLAFQLGRFVRESDAFFPSAAPIQQGTPAFRFDGVRVGGRTQPAPRGFMINYLAQYAGPWTEFSRDLR